VRRKGAGLTQDLLRSKPVGCLCSIYGARLAPPERCQDHPEPRDRPLAPDPSSSTCWPRQRHTLQPGRARTLPNQPPACQRQPGSTAPQRQLPSYSTGSSTEHETGLQVHPYRRRESRKTTHFSAPLETPVLTCEACAATPKIFDSITAIRDQGVGARVHAGQENSLRDRVAAPSGATSPISEEKILNGAYRLGARAPAARASSRQRWSARLPFTLVSKEYRRMQAIPESSPHSDQDSALDLAYRRLSSYPSCAGDFSHGAKYRPRDQAVLKPHIRLDGNDVRSAILIDVDRPGAADSWQDAGLPPPSWTCTNPKNGHAHLCFLLREPIFAYRTAALPKKLFQDTRRAINHLIGGDTAYPGIYTKSPWSSAWIVEWNRAVYDLSELWSEWVSDGTKQHIKKQSCQQRNWNIRHHSVESPSAPSTADVDTGGGRNCMLFDRLRRYAMIRWSALARVPLDSAIDSLVQEGHRLNYELFSYDPLDSAEVVTTSKSVATFIQREFDPRKDRGSFRERQQLRQWRSANSKRSRTEFKIRAAIEELRGASNPISASAVAELIGLSRQAVSKGYMHLINPARTASA
jgi:hypothetical protein